MKIIAGGLAAFLLAGVAHAGVAPAQAQVDAFLATTVVATDQAAQVDARCEAALSLAASVRSRLEARQGPASVDEDFRAYDALYNLLSSTRGEMSVVSFSSPSKAVRDAAQGCISRISDVNTQVSLSQPIYDRLQAIPTAGLDAVARYGLDRQLEHYRLAGVDRDAATRAKVQALQKEIIDLGLIFDKNIAESRGEIVLKSADDLKGLPQDYIAAHKPDADGLIHISTDYPDVGPLMTFAEKPEVRKAMYMVFQNRAWPANEAVLRGLLQKRWELATLLGFRSYADLAAAGKMIGGVGHAAAFLDEVDAAATPAAERDDAVLLAREKKLDPAATVVPAWDRSYVANLVKKEQYSVDAAVVRQYFTYDKARTGIFQLAHDLFGADIRPWNTPVWDKSVTAWELYDGGRLVGRFYLDMHPREGKYTHAATLVIRDGVAGRQVPIGALICNFPAQGPMSRGDVTFFLHEFGHLIHSFYAGRQSFAVGSDNLQWDFVEAPSQLLEEWTWDYDTLRRFATNAQGQPIPAELVAKMNAARHFGEASNWKQEVAVSAISLAYHDQAPTFGITDLWRTKWDRYSDIPYVEGTHPFAAFGHLNNYSSNYYTTPWSKAIALDLFTRFKSAGLRDPKTALAYRRLVLEPGGQQDANDLIKAFLGRPLSTEAFKQYLSAP